MSVWMVLALGVLLALLALAVDGAYLWMAKVEMRNAADAVVLATAQALLNDELLTGRPEAMWQTTQQASREAARYGESNPVLGRPLELRFDPSNPEQSDIVFGYRENAQAREFQAASDLSDVNINSVRIIARRTRERGNPAGMFFGRLLGLPVADVVASASAYLDRDVIGFRPVGKQAVPLVPLALLSDPTLANPRAWESQTLGPLQDGPADAADRFAFDPVSNRFVQLDAGPTPGDGIYEMEVRIPLGNTEKPDQSDEEANGCLVVFNSALTGNQEDSLWLTLARQVREGVTSRDLEETGGQIVLGEDNRVIVAALPWGRLTEDNAQDSLYQALEALRISGQPRIWPVYSAIYQDSDQRTGWTTAIQGFVAGRLAQVDVVTEATDEGSPRRMLLLTVQPCQMAVGSAVTDAARRYAGSATGIPNRYVAKVRLVNE